jgi:crotonobetainyl-CoA:carnitine CoA-transferase CaiB-like acyl-CoA transferase
VGKSAVGTDTESVLGELGYGKEEIERLAGAGVIKLPSSQ